VLRPLLPALHEIALIALSLRQYGTILLTLNSFRFPNCLHLLAVLRPGRPRGRSLPCHERAYETPSSAHLRRLITDSFSLPDTQPVQQLLDFLSDFPFVHDLRDIFKRSQSQSVNSPPHFPSIRSLDTKTFNLPCALELADLGSARQQGLATCR
jgi:hypothetical protein